MNNQKNKKKLIILSSGNGSNLQAIINNIENGKINAEIVAVISNNDSYSLTRAKNHNLNAIFLSHKDYATRENFDRALSEIILPLKPDYIILSGFMRILSPFFIQQFEHKIINIHPSLLPKYKGLNTHQKALDNHDKEHGVTVHFVTEKLDDGEIIAQSKCQIEKNDTVKSLEDKIKKLEYQLYSEVIKNLS